MDELSDDVMSWSKHDEIDLNEYIDRMMMDKRIQDECNDL